MPTPRTKKVTVKAWAVAFTKGKRRLAESNMDGIAWPTKCEAEFVLEELRNEGVCSLSDLVVPCTITYTLPTKK